MGQVVDSLDKSSGSCPPTHCPLCDSDKLGRTDQFRNDVWQVWECHRCTTVFVWPIPDDLTLANSYQYSRYASRVYVDQPWVAASRVRRIGHLLNALERVSKPGGKILDIGCSRGHLLIEAKLRGWVPEGIELDPDTARIANHNGDLTIYPGSAFEVIPKLGAYDAIVMSHWLEHVTRPRLALQLILQHLKPNGLIVMRFPNSDSTLARLVGALWSWFSPPNHLFYFNRRSLQIICKEYSLDPVVVETWRGDAYLMPLELAVSLWRWLSKSDAAELRASSSNELAQSLMRACEIFAPGFVDRFAHNDTELLAILRPGARVH